MSREGQTATTFREKWTRNPDLAFRQTLDETSEIFRWILGRNGFETPAELEAFLGGKRRILDAGCGNGRVTALLRRYSPPETELVGVDLTAARGRPRKPRWRAGRHASSRATSSAISLTSAASTSSTARRSCTTPSDPGGWRAQPSRAA